MKLQIVDIGWGIDRRTGEKSESVVAEACFEGLAVGPLAPVGPTRRVFTLQEVGEDYIVILLSENTGKTATIKRGEEFTHRPLTRDAGHHFRFVLE